MSTIATPSAEDLRVTNNVRPVSGDAEGSPVDKLPAGFYGFTFSPASFEAPLFSRNSFLSFEVHRVEGDSIILGYADAGTVAKLESTGDPVEIDLYPAVKDQATNLITVRHSRIAHAKPLDRAHSNRLRLTFRPA